MTWEPFYSPVAVVDPQTVRFKALAEVEALLGQTEMAQLEVMAAPVQTALAVPVMLEIGREAVYGEASDELLAEAADELVKEATG